MFEQREARFLSVVSREAARASAGRKINVPALVAACARYRGEYVTPERCLWVIELLEEGHGFRVPDAVKVALREASS